MDLNLEKGVVSLYGKNVKIDTLLNKLSSLSGEQIYGLFGHRGIMLPRSINRLALISALNDRIKMIHSNSLTREEFVSLQYYSKYTELQLVNLFKKICNADDFAKYRRNLFKLILVNNVGLNLTDGELNYMKTLPTNKRKIEEFSTFEGYIFLSSLDEKSTFDGVKIDILKDDLIEENNLSDIKLLAEKYNVELVETDIEKLVDELISKGRAVEEVKSSLNRITLIDEAKPLQFVVDLSVIDLNEKYERIIQYVGAEADIEAFEAMRNELMARDAEEENRRYDKEHPQVVENKTMTEHIEAEASNESPEMTEQTISDQPSESNEEVVPTVENQESVTEMPTDDKTVIAETVEAKPEETVVEEINEEEKVDEDLNEEKQEEKENASKASKIAMGILLGCMAIVLGLVIYGVVSIVF